jgi:O-antigen/teichoic acid export membrane protein
VVAGGTWQILSGIFGGILVLVWVMLGGRESGFGPSGIEFFLIASAIGAILNSPSLGISQAYIKYVSEALAKDKEEARKIASKASGIILYIGVGILVVFILFILFGVSNLDDKISFSIVAIAIPIMYMRDIVNNVSGALHRFDYIAIVNFVMMAVIFAGGMFFLVYLREARYTKFLASLILFSTLLMFFAAIYFFKKCSPFSFRSLMGEKIDRKFAREFSSYGLFCLLANIASFGITLQISIFLVKILSIQFLIFDRTVVGVYGVAASAAWVVMFITFMAFPLVPEVSRAKEVGDKKLLDLVVRSMVKFAFAVGVLIIALAAVFAELGLRIFMGKGYVALGGVMPLILAVSGMVFYAISSIFGAVLVGSGKAKFAGLVFGIATIIMIILTFPLSMLPVPNVSVKLVATFIVPTFSLSPPLGIVGPALALLVSGIFTLIPLMWKTRKDLGVKYPMGAVIRPALAVIPPAIALSYYAPKLFVEGRLLANLPLIAIAGVMLVLVYFFLLIFMGNYDGDDYQMIEDTCTSFGLRPVGVMTRKVLEAVHKLSPLAPPL